MEIKNISEIGNRTYMSLEYLYLNSKEIQEHIYELSSKNPNFLIGKNLYYLKEYCTIKMATSRQSGHTTAISKFILNRKNEKWIIMGINSCQSTRYHKLISCQCIDDIYSKNSSVIQFKQGGSVIFSSINSLNGFRKHDMVDNINKLDGIDGIDGIIIDPSFHISQHKMDDIYNTLSPCMTKKLKFFIFVG